MDIIGTEPTKKSSKEMEFENLLLSHKDGILTITVNRESKLNALNFKTIEELDKAIQIAYEDDSVRGVILTGAGVKSFVAGADIYEIANLSRYTSRTSIERGQDVFFKIENCHKPVIAAVNGFALGGGCELAMACHIRVASENARFGVPEVNLGLIPGYGGTQRLPLYIGKSRALELLMTGDMIDANTALTFGLVNYVVPQEQLIAKCEEILRKISAKAPLAIARAIYAVNAHYGTSAGGYQTELMAFSECCSTQDFKEGTTAFIEKRKPAFKGV